MRRPWPHLLRAVPLAFLVGVAAAAGTDAATAPGAGPASGGAVPAGPARDRIDFVLVPAGIFVMGSPTTEWGSKNDERQHQVTITHPFFLAKCEVTQAQWAGVTGTNPSFLYDCPDCPVENVTWYEAVAFCNALSRHLGLPAAYTVRDSVVTWDRAADGIRLPTEAEWEYACRAGTTTAFSAGDCLSTAQENYLGYDPQKGCQKGLWRGQSIAAGSLAPNPWRFHDMHGNVGEWVWDWYADYPAAVDSDPGGPARGATKVIRGGSWRDLGRHCRSACRQPARPDRFFSSVGLRVARSVPERDLHP